MLGIGSVIIFGPDIKMNKNVEQDLFLFLTKFNSFQLYIEIHCVKNRKVDLSFSVIPCYAIRKW